MQTDLHYTTDNKYIMEISMKKNNQLLKKPSKANLTDGYNYNHLLKILKEKYDWIQIPLYKGPLDRIN